MKSPIAVSNFNLRVYGLLLKDGAVLITDEHRGDTPMTKFPGGGLEKGEGLADGLIREFREELDIEIQVGSFFYVNDFLQISAFNPADQLLSFYYIVATNESEKIKITERKRSIEAGEQDFRWVAISDLSPSQFTFPIDRVVCELLRNL